MDVAPRALALLLLLPALAYAGKDKTEKNIYHIAIQGSTELCSKITHKATKAEPYIDFEIKYRCYRPVVNSTVDIKADHENIFCKGPEGPTPAAQGQPLDSEPEPTETIETKEN